MKITQAMIDKERNRVKLLKNDLAQSFKVIFHSWQLLIWNSFKDQVASGQSVVKIPDELIQDLNIKLYDHYIKVAKSFVTGLTFEEFKKSDESEESNYILFWLPKVLQDISQSLQDQIEYRLPVHSSKIIDTTEQIGNRSITWSALQESPYAIALASKLSSRESTVSVTETNWIAEASQSTALHITTPILTLANKKELELLQNVSSNITLRNIDFGNFEELYPENSYEYNSLMNTLSHPKKKWIDIGDNKVRESHARISGTEVNENEPFILPGGKLMYPSDDSLGVELEEIVNCRCWAMYF